MGTTLSHKNTEMIGISCAFYAFNDQGAKSSF